MKGKHLLLTLLFSVFLFSAIAQQALPAPGTVEYDNMKSEGKIPGNYRPFIGNIGGENLLEKINPVIQPANSVQGGPQCNCMQPIDGSFTVVPFVFSTAPDYRNDDGSSAEIQLPFTFCLYGSSYNSMWINNNGNITFDAAFGAFSAGGFPNADNIMVAPFWADVDTRNTGSGLVYYKVTPTHAIIRWQNVGYYSSMADKRNDFQLIITNGNDPLIPIGTNTSFCYGEMQWTTGSASQGVNGFGGIPANVGANRGDGIDYIQFGRFDQPGGSYDGPFNGSDGIDWLDNQSFYFNACLGTSNTPPVVNGINICDSIQQVCVGDTIPLNFSFISLETNQITTTQVNVTNVPGLTGSATTGNTSVVTSEFVASTSNIGTNTLVYTATDDANPPATLTIQFVITVSDYPDPTLVLTDSILCSGEPGYLIALPGYDNYSWYPSGPNNDSLLLTAPGQYYATVSNGFCPARTDTFNVVVGNPIAVIDGLVPFCSYDCITLANNSQNYTQFIWSNGSTDSTASVCDSTIISLIVTDQYGCVDTTTINVEPYPVPTAAFTTNPQTSALVLEPVIVTDQSTSPTDSIVTWDWSFPNATPSTGSSAEETIIYPLASDTTITLIVTNTYGCSDTITINFDAIPPSIPNVFTPNGDGINDFFIIPKAYVLDNCQLFVYSRWGKVVYRSDNYQNDWDGEGHSDGVYYYVVVEPNGDTASGTITILRNGQ